MKIKNILTRKSLKWLLLPIYLIIIPGIFLYHFVHHNSKFVDEKYRVECLEYGRTHEIRINERGFIPRQVNAKACDKVLFVNTGKVYHQVAFGNHPDHLLYPGYREREIAPGKSLTLTLNAFGIYPIHDHFNKELEGEIKISN